ncbi:MAG: DMT family transporter, partial [Desulfobacteraceae bacterium]|nr:DMT family transporter [Desulfobacteraceae bacterium]
MKNTDMTLRASVFTIFLCLFFGGNAVAIKLGFTGLGPFTSAGIRFSMAAIALLLWAWYKKIPLALDPTQRLPILIQSCLFTFQLSCFHIGLTKTTASHGALISNVLPFVVLILAHFFIPGDRITLKKSLGILLGFIGVLLLFFDETDRSSTLQKGDMIVLCAVLTWGISAVYLKRIIAGFHVVQITLYPMIFGIPFLFLMGMVWDDPMVILVTPTVVKALLFQSLVTTAFGFVAWNTMLQRFGATALHSFIFIIPLSGVFLGVMILKEPVTPHLLASIGFIVAGILVVNIRKRKKA